MVMSQGIVDVWQLIFNNYSYFLNQIRCSNGKKVDLTVIKFPSMILLEGKQSGSRLNYLMQMRDADNGHYRFVVCGAKRKERLALRELVAVYENVVWATLPVCICLAVLAWQILAPAGATPSIKNETSYSKKDTAPRNFFSLIKILLEQSELNTGSISLSSHKIRLFLGLILITFIVLSNGYKM